MSEKQSANSMSLTFPEANMSFELSLHTTGSLVREASMKYPEARVVNLGWFGLVSKGVTQHLFNDRLGSFRTA